MLRRVLYTPVFVLLLALPSAAHAAPDSFFDIFVDVSLDDTQCDPCASIEADIAAKQDKIGLIKADIEEIDDALGEVDQEIETLEGDLEELQGELSEMMDPQNYVESEGRRYDSSDHAAMRRRSSNLWDAYKAGDLTAQEYSDEIGKDFDDPDVAKELAKLKKEIIKELKDAIEEAKEQLEDTQNHRNELNAMAGELTAELEACLTELEQLLNALEECRKQCKQGPVKPEGFGLDPEPRSAIDSFFDIFTELFTGPPQILPEPEHHDEDDADDFPIEIVQLDLVGLGPIDVGLGGPIKVLPNPKCQMCDPLRAEIAAKEAALEALEAKIAQAKHGVSVYDRIIDGAEDYLGRLEDSLERLNNPPDYVESEGRRYDSSDHAAMQVRNARLWDAYKSGKMSASDLESEWEKDFDDPDVAKELEKIKKDMKKELEDQIEDTKDTIDEVKEDKQDLEEEIADMEQERADCRAKLAAMYAELAACEKRCKDTEDAIGFIQDLLKNDPPIWEEPTGGFVIPLPDPTDDTDACMSGRECESTCVPEGKACTEVSKKGKTCFVCSDNNDCKEPAVNLKVCEEKCDGSCDRDQSAGPACFNCSGCLDPTTSRRACEETCVPEGGACVQDPAGGKSCFTCDMDNPCKKPAMNLKECEAKCGSCERNEEAGAACFDCKNPKQDEDEEDVIGETSPSSTVGVVDSEESFFCGLPIIGRLCDDEEEEKKDNVVGDFALPYTCCGDGEQKDDCKPCDDEDDADDDVNFMCDWFGVWCPKEPELTLRDAIACANEGQGSRCDTFDHNGDGTVDLDDLSQWTPTLVGPGGLDFPLQINGMDGDNDLSIGDFSRLNDCLVGGPKNCGGLLFGQPGNDILLGDNTIGLDGGNFRPQLVNGSDILLGDPLDPGLINIGGGRDDILGGGDDPLLGDPGRDTLLGPGRDPFPGPVSGAGVDIFGDGEVQSQPNMANDPQVREVVQAAVRRYLQSNPLGPCEKLEVTVRRVRIGNRVRYTVTIKRVRDDSLCPPAVCPPETSFQSIFPPTPEGCSETCQNGNGGCVTIDTLPDGTQCILCGPPDDGDGFESSGVPLFEDGFESGDTTRWGEPSPGVEEEEDEEDDEDEDLCADESRCDDGDECTTDTCDPETGACTNRPITGCGQDDPVECPDIAHTSYDACRAVCSNGTCREMNDFDYCYICQPDELRCPSTMSNTRSECQRSCDGTCFEKNGCWDCVVPEPVAESCPQGTDIEADGPYCSRCESTECTTLEVLSSGTYCLQCIAPKPQQCDSPTMTESACKSSCDGSCLKSYTRTDGVKCFECKEEEKDEGPTCPSGSTADQSACASQCPSDGTCVEDNGCYSCVVVNCPDGTYKNECPGSCSNGCNVVGEQSGVTCYQCKQDCNTVCAENGFGPEDTDHSSAILSELQGYSCVSGANISIQTATIGDCRCVGDYSLSVDTTPPVCAGTPCGDVECGGSASCPGGPNETITVNCNWGGWEKIQKHQFRPVVGN